MTTRPGTSPALRISAITIRFNSLRTFRSIAFSINEIQKKDEWVQQGRDSLKATFTPSLNISISDHLTFKLTASFLIGSKSIGEKDTVVPFKVGDLLRDHAGEQNRQELKGTRGKVEIMIRLWSPEATPNESRSMAHKPFDHGESPRLVPTTEDVLSDCPRFRILVIGKTGVGKSSLINKTFGVEDAHVSDFNPGSADINTEIFSERNPQFVLHDSQGFEPGEAGNLQTVCDFIQARNEMPALKDKLHAIWVCMAIPASGDRLFETGTEKLFRLKNEGTLGEVPMIVVFTKFDELVVREDRKHTDDLSEEQLSELAGKAFERECLEPFRKEAGHQIPYNAVSTQNTYETTLTNLIRTTFENVQHDVGPEVSIVTAIAQKASPVVKIEGCIAVGRLRYWRGLASSAHFLGKTLQACLDVIHTDIVKVWELNDSRVLRSNEFKALMSQLVSDNIQRKPTADPNTGLGTGLALLGTIAGIVAALSGPAAPIVIPIVGGLVLAKWVYDVYEASRNNLEHLVAYIIDLTLVMQNIFWLAEGKRPISKRLVSLALVAYSQSSTKEDVHTEISDYVKQSKFAPGMRDTTLQKIEDIIHRCTIQPEEMFKSLGQIPPFDAGNEDDRWQILTEQSGTLSNDSQIRT